jgi:hypothetical protein
MIDYRRERNKELEKWKKQERMDSTEDSLPEWVYDKYPLLPGLLKRIGAKHKPMEPGTARARIIIREPIPEGTKVKRRKRYDR